MCVCGVCVMSWGVGGGGGWGGTKVAGAIASSQSAATASPSRATTCTFPTTTTTMAITLCEQRTSTDRTNEHGDGVSVASAEGLLQTKGLVLHLEPSLQLVARPRRRRRPSHRRRHRQRRRGLRRHARQVWPPARHSRAHSRLSVPMPRPPPAGCERTRGWRCVRTVRRSEHWPTRPARRPRRPGPLRIERRFRGSPRTAIEESEGLLLAQPASPCWSDTPPWHRHTHAH